jgi:hypothetical protein
MNIFTWIISILKKPGRTVTAVPMIAGGLLLIIVVNASARTYWDAIFEIGYDPFKKHVDPLLACDRLDKIFRLNTLISDHLVIDKKLRSRLHEFQSQAVSVGAREFHDESFHAGAGGQWQTVGFRGSSGADGYLLYLIDPEINKGISLTSNPMHPLIAERRHEFGDIKLHALLRPTRENTFIFVTHGRLYLDDLPAENLTRVLNGILKTMRVQASGGDDQPADVYGASHLNNPSQKILHGFAKAFPNLFEFICRYTSVDAVAPAGYESISESVMFSLRARLKRDALFADYPEGAKILPLFKSLISFQSRVYDAHGGLRLVLQIDFRNNALNIRFRISDGRQLPMIGDRFPGGQAIFGTAVSDANIYRVVSDIRMSVLGLRLNIEKLQMNIAYVDNKDGLRLRADLNKLPGTVAIKGRMLGVFPLWLVDLLIPCSVEEIAMNFLKTLVKGNQGRGAVVELGSPSPASVNNSLWLRSEAEIGSYGALALGSRFYRALGFDDVKLGSQLGAFRKHMWHALYQDYRGMLAQKHK